MSDDKANQLAELQIQKDKAVRDMDLIESAMRSNKQSLEHFTADTTSRLSGLRDQIDQEESSEKRVELLDNFQIVLLESADEFSSLLRECDRLQVQEKIVAKMAVELDRQIADLKRELK